MASTDAKPVPQKNVAYRVTFPILDADVDLVTGATGLDSEVSKDGGTFTVIDDYGHHPVEMAATLAAARGAFPGRRLVLAFQPHRYTRTRDCFEDFVNVIGTADRVVLTEVYAAGEDPIVAADSRSLARALRVAGKVEPVFVADVFDLPAFAIEHARGGDVVMCMGAGSIGAIPAKIVELLQKIEHNSGVINPS